MKQGGYIGQPQVTLTRGTETASGKQQKQYTLSEAITNLDPTITNFQNLKVIVNGEEQKDLEVKLSNFTKEVKIEIQMVQETKASAPVIVDGKLGSELKELNILDGYFVPRLLDNRQIAVLNIDRQTVDYQTIDGNTRTVLQLQDQKRVQQLQEVSSTLDYQGYQISFFKNNLGLAVTWNNGVNQVGRVFDC